MTDDDDTDLDEEIITNQLLAERGLPADPAPTTRASSTTQTSRSSRSRGKAPDPMVPRGQLLCADCIADRGSRLAHTGT
jgi:hypothetical protein